MTSTTTMNADAMPDGAPNPALVCGYIVDGAGDMRPVEWAQMDEALSQESSLVWLHFNQADPEARRWIEQSHRIPAAATKILLGTDNHMRIETADGGLAGTVGDLHHEFAGKSEDLDTLRLYLDNSCLISARRRPLQAVDKLRRSLGEGLKVRRPIGLLTQFLHHVTDTLGDLILGLTARVDEIEERVLEDKAVKTGDDLSHVRRVAARLRRHMVPQQHALLGLMSRLPGWVAEGETVDLRSAVERLTALGHDLDLVQERARLLQEQIAAKLMEANNRNLYILAIITTVFLPMTLITGVFGMNLGGLPGQQDPMGFWYGIVFMVAAGVLTLVAVNRARMF